MPQVFSDQQKYLRFPGQKPDEKVDLTMRQHPFYIIYNFLIVIFGSMFLFFAYINFPNQLAFFSNSFGQAILTFVFILGLMLVFFVSFTIVTHYYLDIYILTNHRMISINQVDFFHRTINEASVDKVQDLEVVTKGFFATLLDFGDLRIHTAGAELHTLVFHNIANPAKVKDLILDLAHKKNRHQIYLNPKEEIIT
jgi:uncharacterized membrane protein YdbT with pleckstrin-like domain